MVERCVSCNTEVSVSKHHTLFKCPSCDKVTLYRCDNCRRRMVKYKCPNCGFEGP